MSKAALTRVVEGGIDSLYDVDFYAWTQRTADLLRARRIGDVDAGHAAEEIEDMGKRDAKELKSRMRVLILHLLKWQLQPKARSRSWAGTVTEQRQEIGYLLEQSPSLRRLVAPNLSRVYRDAVKAARAETGLSARRFPAECPYSTDQLLDDAYWP